LCRRLCSFPTRRSSDLEGVGQLVANQQRAPSGLGGRAIHGPPPAQCSPPRVRTTSKCARARESSEARQARWSLLKLSELVEANTDRKSTRLNSSHASIS